MKACFLAMLPLLVASYSFAQLPPTEEEVIKYSKSIDVKTLDASLPSQRLEDWLRSGPAHTQLLRWESDETCDNKPFRDLDYPRCVRVTFGRGGQSGYFLVLIGTRKKGIIGPPRLYEGIGVQQEPFVQTGWAERLSGIPYLLDQPVVTKSVDDFYERIVKYHPIGIPTGSDKTALWPFLSQRLTRQLDIAQACQDNYFIQHSNAGAGPKPAWLDVGIFVGHGKRAIPLSAFAARQERQGNGSFVVSVVFTYVKLPGFVPDEANWVVNAIVIQEKNRLVLDDVRLFDGLATDGPSHLLSEEFTGCDGTHWTGKHAEDFSQVTLPSPHYTDWDAVNSLRNATYNEEVAFAKGLDVNQLDPSLTSQRLENWLNSASLHLNHIEWEGLKCNFKEGGYGEDGSYIARRDPERGLCAGVWFQRGNARGHIRVNAPGTSVRPKVQYLNISDKDDGLLKPMDDHSDKISDSDKLSELPRLLAEEAVIDVTRNLYEAVVARHPLGIPRGQDKVKLRPLLSKRLREQLDTAQACQADYQRHNPHPSVRTNPAWFMAGLFSGDGSLALPSSEFVDRKTRQDDGTFLVRVWLSHESPRILDTAPPASRWRTWHVSAVVKSEDGRFVIDDVQLFGSDLDEDPPRLLSASLSGCDGGRWAGIHTTTK